MPDSGDEVGRVISEGEGHDTTKSKHLRSGSGRVKVHSFLDGG